jgi:hypothetical protein
MHPGVIASWRTYGTSGWERTPQGLVTENYRWRGPDDHPGNRFGKSIVYPRRTLDAVSAHYFKLRGTPVGEDGRPRGRPVRDATADLLRINHYFAKSEEEFRRKESGSDAYYGTMEKRSFLKPPDAVRDEIILQFGPQLRAMLSSRVARQSPTVVAPQALTPSGGN